MAKRITVCAGIDTGKRKLDVAIDGSCEQLQVENTADGHKMLWEWLQRHNVKRIGIEASGGYEQPVRLMRSAWRRIAAGNPFDFQNVGRCYTAPRNKGSASP